MAVCALLLGACGGGSTTSVAGSTRVAQERLKVMALGDSLTANPAYYRRHLAEALAGERCRTDFVGSMADPAMTPTSDRGHEGHHGLRADELAPELEDWARDAMPDVVLLQAGTNDIVQGKTVPQTVIDIDTLISRLHSADPEVIVLVGLLLPLVGYEEQVTALNRAIVNLVTELRRSSTALVTTVDLGAGFDPAKHFAGDGKHPNRDGSVRIAEIWFDAYVGAVGSRSCDPLGS